jgi:hypothetical protein
MIFALGAAAGVIVRRDQRMPSGGGSGRQGAAQVCRPSLPLGARLDDLEVKRVVDREHRRVGGRVGRADAFDLGSFTPDAVEHRRLRPLGQPESAVSFAVNPVLHRRIPVRAVLPAVRRLQETQPTYSASAIRPAGTRWLPNGTAPAGEPSTWALTPNVTLCITTGRGLAGRVGQAGRLGQD